MKHWAQECPTGCSEDTYLFYKVLKLGYTIFYEQDAFVWHRHRNSMEAFRKQIYGYSRGHVAYHLTTLINDGDLRVLGKTVGWFATDSSVANLRAYSRVDGLPNLFCVC